MNSQHITYTQMAKQRLDEYLCQKLDLTRSRIKNLIEDGKILVNGQTKKSGYSLKDGDDIFVDIPEDKPLEVIAEDVDFDIVFQNADYAIINKPQGVVVHPANGNLSGTLVNGLLKKIKDLSGINGVIRPGIVHRLDKDTSGLLVVAKNDKAHVELANQIQFKTCHRYYYALVYGNVKKEEDTIITNIARSKKDRKKMSVSSDTEGKLAITKYKVVEHFGSDYTLLEFKLETGRTHQIRVHSAYINHGIVGDEVYARVDKNFKTKGQLLHAYKLELNDPSTNERKIFQIPLPVEFENILKILRKKYC